MNRTIGIERVFKLGEYKSLRVVDTLIDVPEELAMNTEAIDELKQLLLLDADLTYQRYYAITILMDKYHDGQEKTNALMELRANLLDEYNQLIKKETGE